MTGVPPWRLLIWGQNKVSGFLIMCHLLFGCFEEYLAVKHSWRKPGSASSQKSARDHEKEILPCLVQNIWCMSLSPHCCGQCSLFILELCSSCCCFCQTLGWRTVTNTLHAMCLMDWMWAAGQDDIAQRENSATDCLTEMKNNWIIPSSA